MPIILPPGLPAAAALEAEGLPVLTPREAEAHGLRPLEVLLVNLMPDKITTETQLARMLAGTALPVRLTLAHMAGHQSRHVPPGHLEAFYQTVEAATGHRYHGMIVTGAPIELLAYRDIDYWAEMAALADYARRYVPTTLYLCWAAMAALCHRYGISKDTLPQKLHGVFQHRVRRPRHPLMQGIEDGFWVPHSRQAEIPVTAMAVAPGLQILADSSEAGLHIVAGADDREIYIFGHMEYDEKTLWMEYNRDLGRSPAAPIPRHYFYGDDPAQGVHERWRETGRRFYANWLTAAVAPHAPVHPHP